MIRTVAIIAMVLLLASCAGKEVIPLEVKHKNWVAFWKTPLYPGLFGLRPYGLGNNISSVPYTGR